MSNTSPEVLESVCCIEYLHRHAWRCGWQVFNYEAQVWWFGVGNRHRRELFHATMLEF